MIEPLCLVFRSVENKPLLSLFPPLSSRRAPLLSPEERLGSSGEHLQPRNRTEMVAASPK